MKNRTKSALLFVLAFALPAALAGDLNVEQKKQWQSRIEKVCVPLMNKHKKTNKSLAKKNTTVVCKCIATKHIQHADDSGSLTVALAHLAWVEDEYRSPRSYPEDETGNLADVDMQIATECLAK